VTVSSLHLSSHPYASESSVHTEVDKIVTRKGGLNCDPLKIILKLKKQFSSSLLGGVKLIF